MNNYSGQIFNSNINININIYIIKLKLYIIKFIRMVQVKQSTINLYMNLFKSVI